MSRETCRGVRRGRSRSWGLWLAAWLGGFLLCASSTHAQDSGAAGAPPVSDQEVVDRLLELQEEIERLLPFLPPDLREEIAEQLARRAETQRELAERAVERALEPPREEPLREEPAGRAPGPETAHGEETGRTVCNTLAVFDTREDGRIDAGDRYWRYLYLWTDRNGDGEVAEHEVRSAFDAGIRAIAVNLERFEGEDDEVGLVRVGRWIVLDPAGDGFSGGVSGDVTGPTDDGALTVDASALGRFSGPRLLGPDGQPLAGMQPFRPGLSLRVAPGRVTELSCPR